MHGPGMGRWSAWGGVAEAVCLRWPRRCELYASRTLTACGAPVPGDATRPTSRSLRPGACGFAGSRARVAARATCARFRMGGRVLGERIPLASAPMRRPAYLFAALVLAAPGIAQVVDADEAPVRWVDGRPMLRATLRAGEKLYFCHLLLDLTTKDALFLHRNAAGSLRASSCDVEIGGIVLRDVPFTAQPDTWLE